MNDVILQVSGPMLLPASPEQAQLLAAQQSYMQPAMYNPGMMFMGPQVLGWLIQMCSRLLTGCSTCRLEWNHPAAYGHDTPCAVFLLPHHVPVPAAVGPQACHGAT